MKSAYQTDTAAIAAIHAADDARMKAMVASDHAALEHLLADELIYTHIVGRTETKPTYLVHVEPGHYVSVERVEDTVWVNGDTGWMHGHTRLQLLRDGELVLREVRFVSVWVKQGGAWRLAIWTGTPIAALTPK